MPVKCIQVNSLNNTCGPYHDLFKNTIASWQCIVNRQRWFRCLEKVSVFYTVQLTCLLWCCIHNYFIAFLARIICR